MASVLLAPPARVRANAPILSRLGAVFVFGYLITLQTFSPRFPCLYGFNSKEMGRAMNSVLQKSRCNTRENAREFAKHDDFPSRIVKQPSSNTPTPFSGRNCGARLGPFGVTPFTTAPDPKRTFA